MSVIKLKIHFSYFGIFHSFNFDVISKIGVLLGTSIVILNKLFSFACYTTVESRYLEFDGTIFYKFKLPEVQIMVGESNENVFLYQKNALSFAEFEISIFDSSL